MYPSLCPAPLCAPTPIRTSPHPYSSCNSNTCFSSKRALCSSPPLHNNQIFLHNCQQLIQYSTPMTDSCTNMRMNSPPVERESPKQWKNNNSGKTTTMEQHKQGDTINKTFKVSAKKWTTMVAKPWFNKQQWDRRPFSNIVILYHRIYKIQCKVNIPCIMHQPNWRKQTTTTKNNMHQASTKHKAHAQSNVFEQATMGEEVSQQWTSSWPVGTVTNRWWPAARRTRRYTVQRQGEILFSGRGKILFSGKQ